MPAGYGTENYADDKANPSIYYDTDSKQQYGFPIN